MRDRIRISPTISSEKFADNRSFGWAKVTALS